MIKFVSRCLFLIMMLFSAQGSAKKYDLCICSMFQNEARFLKEWIEFHQLVGVEHFWLYNNNSTDNYKEVLQPYVEKGIVELIEWPSVQQENDFKNHTYTVQIGAFNDAIKRSRGKTKWLAILDADEFLFSPIDDNVAKVLEKYYKKYSGVCVNWQLFGTSNVDKIGSNELMIERLLLKAETQYERNKYYKSIVRPEDVRRCGNPHYCSYNSGCYNVNANKQRFRVKNPGIFVDKLRINHYWVRDEDYMWNVKIPRYLKWNVTADGILHECQILNKTPDDTILRFAPKLKKKMFGKK